MRAPKEIVCALVALLCACQASSVSPREATLAIEHVNVIPMDREQDQASQLAFADQTVLVDGELVVAIGRQLAIPPGARRIDGRGKWLMPGLTDMHTHLLSDDYIADEFAPDQLAVILANGVTTIRDPIGKPELLELKRRVAAREVLGPELWVASPQICGRKYSGVFHGTEVHSPDEARTAVRGYAADGYDFIKTTMALSLESYDAVIDEAHRQDIRVIGHVGANVPVTHAIAAGHQIEHLDEFLDALVPADAPFKGSVSDIKVWSPKHWQSLDWLDESKIAPLVRACVDANTFNTPTLTFFKRSFGEQRSDEELRASPDWGFVSDDVREELLKGREHYWKDPPSVARRERYVAIRNRITKELHDAGAKLMCGADAPEWMLLGGFTTHRELESFVAAGLSNYAALETATRNPHEWLGDLERVGTLAVGKRADLLLLDANPLEAIGNTRRIAGVASRGRWLDRAELDALLEHARQRLSSAPLLPQ